MLPKYPCVALNDDGLCSSMVVIGKYEGLGRTGGPSLPQFANENLPADWDWKQATVSVVGDAWYNIKTGGGAGAAKVTAVLVTDQATQIKLGADSLPYLGFGTAARNGPVRFGQSYVHSRSEGGIRQVGLISPECKGYTGLRVGEGTAADTNATCDFSAAIAIHLTK